ncbi:MAG: B12-binding domain-containing radical SAM protein [Chloroflexi bacterium]|nr:B12-binding domain-containing radical SAM protein [Chloroflexota bacterium]
MPAHEIFLINFRNERDLYPPFGIMYVADALIKAGFGVRLFHETEAYLEEFMHEVERARPLFVGFSTITGPQLKPVIKASKRVHEMGIAVVWGGVHATIMPEDCLREEYVDYVVVNEGEETVVELARMFAGADMVQAEQIMGLAHKAGGKPIVNIERPFIKNLDDYRPRWDLIPVERYLLQSGPYQRALPVYISRGCPFRCGFCYNEVVMKRTWRQHSDSVVVEQIEWLKEHYRIDAVDYADDYLFGRIRPMQRLVEKVGMPWSGQVRCQLLKPEFVQWMVKTGCQWVNIGAESGSQAVLDSIHKDQKAGQIEWAVRNLAGYAPHIEANLSFIIGLPAETHEDSLVTIRLIERLAAINEKARCSVCVYMPYPGTPLWPEALARGFVPPPTQDGWTDFDLNRGNTPLISDAEARVMSDINDILFVGKSRGHWLLGPYYALLRWRWHQMYFKHYWEGRLKAWMGTGLLGRVRDRLIERMVDYNANTHKGPTAEMAAQ